MKRCKAGTGMKSKDQQWSQTEKLEELMIKKCETECTSWWITNSQSRDSQTFSPFSQVGAMHGKYHNRGETLIWANHVAQGLWSSFLFLRIFARSGVQSGRTTGRPDWLTTLSLEAEFPSGQRDEGLRYKGKESFHLLVMSSQKLSYINHVPFYTAKFNVLSNLNLGWGALVWGF